VAENEDQHVAGRDDLLAVALALLGGRPQPHDFIRRHQGPLDLFDACVNVIQDGGNPRTGEIARGVCRCVALNVHRCVQRAAGAAP
jgi:hypothetical protein